jgi:hypothetical protein
MLHLRSIGPLFVFVLAVAAPVPSRALTYTPFGTPAPSSATAIDRFLALSVSDFGGQAAGIVSVTAVADQVEKPSTASLLAYASDEEGDEQAVIRHRGFRKAILIVLICGAIIRFLTSVTFLKFITDALDPKAW